MEGSGIFEGVEFVDLDGSLPAPSSRPIWRTTEQRSFTSDRIPGLINTGCIPPLKTTSLASIGVLTSPSTVITSMGLLST